MRWQGYGKDADTWEPRAHLHPDTVTEFLQANNQYEYDWTGARCEYCDKPCASLFGVKIHQKYCHMVDDGPQQFQGRKAEVKAIDVQL